MHSAGKTRAPMAHDKLANAADSGLLIYAGLVQMFYEDFLSPQGQKKLRGRKAKASACIALVLGCVGMSVVGAWA